MSCPCGLRAVKYFVILCSGLQPPAARLPPPAIELKFQGFPPRGHDRSQSASFVQAQSESLQLSSAHNFRCLEVRIPLTSSATCLGNN